MRIVDALTMQMGLALAWAVITQHCATVKGLI